MDRAGPSIDPRHLGRAEQTLGVSRAAKIMARCCGGVKVTHPWPVPRSSGSGCGSVVKLGRGHGPGRAEEEHIGGMGWV